MAVAGLSTLGITLGWASGALDSKPSDFTTLTRINSIGGISMDTEQIDASALEDLATKYIAGRADTSGSWEIVVNYTPDTIAEWKALIAAYQSGKASGEDVWFELTVPGMTEKLYVVGQPPQVIPMPEIGQNELLTVTFTITIVEYKGAM